MKDLIEKWKLNKTVLAERMKMSKSYFNNKLMERENYKLTKDEYFKLGSIIEELMFDIQNCYNMHSPVLESTSHSVSRIQECPKGVFDKWGRKKKKYNIAIIPNSCSTDSEQLLQELGIKFEEGIVFDNNTIWRGEIPKETITHTTAEPIELSNKENVGIIIITNSGIANYRLSGDNPQVIRFLFSEEFKNCTINSFIITPSNDVVYIRKDGLKDIFSGNGNMMSDPICMKDVNFKIVTIDKKNLAEWAVTSLGINDISL